MKDANHHTATYILAKTSETSKKKKKRAIDLDLKILWLGINRMYNLESKRGDITSNMGFVLLHIDTESGSPATKIAPLMGMEPRSLTRMLAKMEEKGLVYRKADSFDRRMVRIFPTELGKQVKAVAKEVVIGFNKEIYNNIPLEKLEVFFEVIDGINEIVKNKVNS